MESQSTMMPRNLTTFLGAVKANRVAILQSFQRILCVLIPLLIPLFLLNVMLYGPDDSWDRDSSCEAAQDRLKDYEIKHWLRRAINTFATFWGFTVPLEYDPPSTNVCNRPLNFYGKTWTSYVRGKSALLHSIISTASKAGALEVEIEWMLLKALWMLGFFNAGYCLAYSLSDAEKVGRDLCSHKLAQIKQDRAKLSLRLQKTKASKDNNGETASHEEKEERLLKKLKALYPPPPVQVVLRKCDTMTAEEAFEMDRSSIQISLIDDPYTLLNVTKTSTKHEILAAFKKAVQQWIHKYGSFRLSSEVLHKLQDAYHSTLDELGYD